MMTQWNINLGPLMTHGQIRDLSDDEIGAPDDLMGKLGRYTTNSFQIV